MSRRGMYPVGPTDYRNQSIHITETSFDKSIEYVEEFNPSTT